MAINHAGLKWMFSKSADEIARAKMKKARDEHVREAELEEKAKNGIQPEIAIDWSSENQLTPFTFSIK